MTDLVSELGGVPVLVCGDDGPAIGGPQDALDLIGGTYASTADTVAVPAGRFDAEFFRLRSGVAGEIMQKFVNYRVRLVVVGDISAHTEASTALRDLVTESNRGSQIWFVDDLDQLAARLR
jgi:hypothetical protein